LRGLTISRTAAANFSLLLGSLMLPWLESPDLSFLEEPEKISPIFFWSAQGPRSAPRYRIDRMPP
jgi:hypothetical protein